MTKNISFFNTFIVIRLLLFSLLILPISNALGNNQSVVLDPKNSNQDSIDVSSQGDPDNQYRVFEPTVFPLDEHAQVAEDNNVESNFIENPRAAIFNPKSVTPNRLFSADLSKPVSFVSSNNLVRKAGSFYQAVGEVIHLKGKITDSFGVPVSGALIDIWQTNSAGKYQSLLEKNSEYMDVNFNMSGRAITDNLGNYHFVTVMPGSYLNRAPHINMNIYHKSFANIETEIYFQNHPKNLLDHEYLSYSDKEKELLTSKVKLSNMFDKKSGKICTFNVVMDGVHKYKSFGGV